MKFVVDKMALMEVSFPRTLGSFSQYHSTSVNRDRVVGIMIRVRAGLTEEQSFDSQQGQEIPVLSETSGLILGSPSTPQGFYSISKR